MKKILTSNGKILTENGKILTANVESGGGLIEVSELPEVGKANTVYKLIHKNVGTEVPTTGLIENVYLNTSLSIDEVNAILKTIEYIPATNEGEPDIYIVLETLDSIVRIFDYNNGSYAITVGMNVAYVSDESFASAGATFVGWNPDLTNPCVVNQESTPTDDFVSQNDKLTSLFSITPFEEEKIPSEMYYLFENSEWQQISGGILEVNNLPTSGEDNYVYKLSQQPTYEIYVNIEGQGVLKLKDIAQQEGAHIELVEVVNSKEKLPSNPIEFTGMEQISVYYVRNDDLYVYGAFGENDTKIWFSFSTLMEMSFSGEVASTDDMIVVNTMYVLSIPNDCYDYYMYENSVPTQVPNSGLIENLYFNTKLSNEEVDNILSQLTYDYDGYAYVVGAYEKGSSYGNIIIVEANAFTQGQIPSGYIIGHMHDTTNMASTEFIYMSNQGLVDLALTLGINTKVGWNMETLNLNQTFIGHYGTENDKLINVISTTPYPHWTEISGGGATVKATPIAVPNSGYVERVYFNTKLTDAEIVATLEKLATLEGMTTVIWPTLLVYIDENNTVSISAMKSKFGDVDEKFWVIELIESAGGINTIWSERSWNDGKNIINSGWSIGVNYIDINHEVVPEVKSDFDNGNIGNFNSEITNLFSLNGVFQEEEIELTESYDGNPLVLSNKYVKKTVVPNEGYVERVYLNTALSIDEVKAILNNYIAKHLSNENLNGRMILTNVDNLDNPSDEPEKWALLIISQNVNTKALALLNGFADVLWTETTEGWVVNYTGWKPDLSYVEVNHKVYNFCEGISNNVGAYNDELVDLFSLTPFEEKIYDSVEVNVKELIENQKLPLKVNFKVTPTTVTKQGGWVGTQVPNSGYIEKLYFNTNLNQDEVNAILNELEFVDWNGGLRYSVTEDSNQEGVYITKSKEYDNVYYIQDGLVSGAGSGVSIFTGSTDDTWEWKRSERTINAENVLNKSLSFGQIMQNEKLTRLISTTPFKKETETIELSGDYEAVELEVTENTTVDVGAMLDEGKIPMSVTVNVASSGGGGSATIKRTLSGGTAITNTGTLREIYFNTDLSVEEVAEVLSQATYTDGSNYVLMAQDNSNGISIMQDSGMYVIFNPITQEILFIPVDIGMGFVGWNTNLIVDKKYTFNSEITLVTDDTIGADNELIKNVVSSSSDFTPKNETVELSGDYDGSSINILAGEELDIKSLIENEKKIPLKVIDKSKTLPQLFAPTISVTSENRIRITNIHKNGDFNLLRVEYRLCVDGVKTSDGAYYDIDQTPDSTTIMELPLPTEYGSGTHTVSVFAFHEHFIDSELSNEVEITIA